MTSVQAESMHFLSCKVMYRFILLFCLLFLTLSSASKVGYQVRMHEIFRSLTDHDALGNSSDPGSFYYFMKDGQRNSNAQNYWQLANVFDTLLDYLRLAQKHSWLNASMVESAVKMGYDRYSNSYGCWYDDYGWWGIAATKAWDPLYDDVFQGHREEFKDVATSTFEFMTHGSQSGHSYGAPYVWNTTDQKIFALAEPRFSGGLWQYDLFEEYVKGDCSGSNPSTPLDLVESGFNANVLGPYQLTVVNGLYLVLASKLSSTNTTSAEEKLLLDGLFEFYKSWITDPSLQPAHMVQSPETGLIAERVATYAHEVEVHAWNAYTAWAGDQGLIMAGMLLMPARSKEDSVFAQTVAAKICKGVLEHMLDSGGMIQPWFPIGTLNKLPTVDPGDYSSGIGVYMRYLLYSLWHDQETVTALLQTPEHKRMVFKAADASVAGTFPDFGNPFFNNLNQLATLLLAHELGQHEGKVV